MKKKILISSIIIIVGIAVILILFNIKPKINQYTKYKRLDNPYTNYKYINSYDEYMDFIEKEEITKSDYYESFSEDDFDNQTYLVVAIPYDSCSESIEKDQIKEDENIYKVYLDMAYSCGVCAPAKKVLTYKVDKTNLEVKIYTKTVSRKKCDPNVSYKPMIYIYPEKDMDLIVKLGNKHNLLYTYPKYNDEWNVHVSKDGNIYDYNTKRNYYGLYWEGIDNYKLDMTSGFVVKGSDTVKFLEKKLKVLGLNDYEINEFIVYWIDKLELNNYNFISFRDIKSIEESMPLYVDKKPDTLIRVMMDYKPLNDYIKVKPQQLIKVKRKGFTIVEWGGTKHN